MQEDAHLKGLVQLQNMYGLYKGLGIYDSRFGSLGFSVRLRVEEYEIP